MSGPREAPFRRREFMAAAAACVACGGAASPPDALVDVHFHLFPPAFMRQAPASADQLRNNPRVADWSAEAALKEMDRLSVAYAVLSFPQPSMWSLDRDAQRTLAAMTNDWYAEVVRAHPGRFGLFAGLPPLTDVDGALAEIERALDKLGARGVRVMTSYQDRWLGDAAFEPVWRELDRRRAVVFVHPDLAACCRNLGAAPAGYAELPLDTGRTAASLWFSGVLERYPNMRLILSHGGGALPMIAGRLEGFGRSGGAGQGAQHDALQAFSRVYVDTANAANRPALAGLRALVGPDRVLFGTDAPFVGIEAQIADLRAASLTRAEWRAIARGNADRLLGRTP